MTFAKLIRYAAVSAVSTVTALTLLGLLVGLAGAPAGWSNAFATAAATVPSFELNRRWVWGARPGRSLLRQAGPFFALSLSGLALSTLTVHIGEPRHVWRALGLPVRLLRPAALPRVPGAGGGTIYPSVTSRPYHALER